MEKFRKTLQIRLRLMGTYFALLALCVIVGRAFGGLPGKETISEYALGFGIGIEFVLLLLVFRYTRALRSKELLERLYIQEKDERNRFIKEKTGDMAMNLVLGGLAFGMLVAGFFFGMQAFYALLGALLFVALLKFFLKMVYRCKY